MRRFPLTSFRLSRFPLTLLAIVALPACGGDAKEGSPGLHAGQTEFESAPPNGGSGRGNGGVDLDDGAGLESPSAGGGGEPRKVEETDIYRLEGDRLYYLNSFRGLMVFDVSNIDEPKLLGRSAIYGEPVEMIVRDGVANVVVSDWYGTTEDGEPFHGSIVRGIDARDPANMRVTGDARLGGWVRDTRVVGDVLYAVTEKYSWDYGWYGYGLDDAGVSVSSNGTSVSVSSVSFAGGEVESVDHYDVPGYGGVFNVTSDAILLASDIYERLPGNDYDTSTGQSELRYLDISDPEGEIRVRGAATIDGSMQNWSADNGRWNLDFADETYAHAVTRTDVYDGSGKYSNSIHVTTVDFSDPDAPSVTGTLSAPMPGWDVAARFDGNRLYLSPTSWGCSYDGAGNPTGAVSTPLEVYDVSDPAAPGKVGSTTIDGTVSLMIPNGDRLFSLGNDYDCTSGYRSPISLSYFDVSDPTNPVSLGSAEFAQNWGWTPAAGTFKAFIKDDAQGLVLLPFSGWDDAGYTYQNGVQIIEYTDSSIATSGTAKTKGWVERGIFVNGRIVSLSDQALSVIDYADQAAPQVVSELTLARNVVNVRPVGDNVVEVSSDFWDNDTDHSVLRVLPANQAEENVSGAELSSLDIAGVNPTVFHDGDVTYVVSNVRREIECEGAQKGDPVPGAPGTCYSWTQEVQAVDVSDGKAVELGKIALPNIGGSYWGWGWGWYGCMAYDWYYGADVIQVGGDKLAFRRWMPQYDSSGNYVDALESLFVVDLSDPTAPKLGSTVITEDHTAWWGNLRAIGDQLYTSHYEWLELPRAVGETYYPGRVRYFIDRIDLSDPVNPQVERKINVPGVLVGGSEVDESIVYTMDYRWDGTRTHNQLAVLKLDGDKAVLQGSLSIPGYTGNVFVRGSTAYFSVETYDEDSGSEVRLFQVDVSDPRNPVVLPSEKAKGWGWLLAVEGDRAFVTSGWYNQGIDVFRLEDGKAPAFEQFVRTRGYWASSLARKGDTAFLASGYWGTQVIDLK